MPPLEINSRPHRPMATVCCFQCKTLLEFSVPAPSSSSTSFAVVCHSCQAKTTVQASTVKVLYTPLAEDKRNSTTDQNRKSMPAKFGGKTGTDENPLEAEYYELLGVSTQATPNEIKKGYYMMAMKFHPDKNTEDPEAEEKFKRISEAYQVLYDPQKRTIYNQYGKSMGGSESAFMDPSEFFKQQFGGEKFADIIGEISIARDFKDAMANMGPDGSADASVPTMSMEERNEIRSQRVKALSNNLVNKLSLYTEAFPVIDSKDNQPIGTSFEQIAREALESFRDLVKIEADGLKTESYGVELLHAIGFTYCLKAQQHLAKMDVEHGDVFAKVFGFGTRIHANFKEKAHVVSETVGTFQTAMDLQKSFQKLQEIEKKTDEKRKEKGAAETDAHVLTEEEAQLKLKLEREAADKGMQALWRGSKLEVEAVLREVCDRVLGDETVSKEIRRRRAEALRVVGQVYETVRSDDAPAEVKE
ncbi:X-domain of DnaJ-containing-domain-containing protein [Polychytrium aggregatum]|uniref:X-domain of DnaJ-containing-domain-containing protein n=1 Tax=Polychytrium aggregatum TaxID=110093 RepID=UPI0022FF3DD8|nr:X-domain of DnaJ-containing-domain-containing protein [Polychytrium aggregatum]KAI9208520.1 X-domain of DnaJ-containing-domain-containing protein [Polychytrium aggregatum]